MGGWGMWLLMLWAVGLAQAARALEIAFEPVAPGVYAYVGDTGGRTYDNDRRAQIPCDACTNSMRRARIPCDTSSSRLM